MFGQLRKLCSLDFPVHAFMDGAVPYGERERVLSERVSNIATFCSLEQTDFSSSMTGDIRFKKIFG